MKEIDVLLERFVAVGYEGASVVEQKAFDRLLDLQDPVLYRLLIGQDLSPNPEMSGVIEKIQRCSTTIDAGDTNSNER